MSSLAFTVVKYAGALYLVALGLKALRAPSPAMTPTLPTVGMGRIFRDGFVVALLNPKTALFFAAFLPQFMSPNGAPMLQSMVLGSLFVAMAVVTDTAYAFAAGAAAPVLARAHGAGAAGRYLTGGAFIGLGVFTALAGSRGTK